MTRSARGPVAWILVGAAGGGLVAGCASASRTQPARPPGPTTRSVISLPPAPAPPFRRGTVVGSGSWSTVISPPVAAGGTTAVALSSDGGAAQIGITLLPDGPISCQHPVGIVGSVVLSSGSGLLSAPQDLGRNIDAGPVARGNGAAALLSKPHALTSTCATTEALELADIGPSGSVVRSTRLEDDAVVTAADIAGNARGDVAAAWIGDTGDDGAGGAVEHDTLRASLAPAAGAPGGDVTIATLSSTRVFVGPIGSVAVTLDARGDTLVAYSTYSQVLAVTLSRGGVLGRTQVIGPCDLSCDLSASEAPNGRAVVAWGSQQIGGDGAVDPYVVRAAIRPGPDAPFAGSIQASGSFVDDQSSGPPQVAIAPTGRVVLEWGNVAGPNTQAETQPIYAAIAGPDGSFGPVSRLARNGYTGSVAIRPDGATLITWVQTPNQPEQDGPIRVLFTPARDLRGGGVPVSLPGIGTGFAPHAVFTAAGNPLVVSTVVRAHAAAVAISTDRR